MRIATWNINAAHILSESGKYDREDLRYIIDALKEVDADVVCLQEVAVPETGLAMADSIAMALGMFVEYAPAFPNHVTGSAQLGQATLSKSPILSSTPRTIRYPKPEIFFKGDGQFGEGKLAVLYDRLALECEIVVGDQEVTVLNIHLAPIFRFTIDPSDPMLEPVRKKIESLLVGRREEPFIAVGDYNAFTLPTYLQRVFEKGYTDAVPQDVKTHVDYGQKSDAILMTSSWKTIATGTAGEKADHLLCWADVELKK